MKRTIFTITKPRVALRYCSALLLSPFFYLPLANAQDVISDPLFGTESIEGGFVADPFKVNIIAGGPFDASTGDSNCSGYIAADQPDFRIHYTPSNYPLGIFVNSLIDTTLIVNTPDGSWECNDDFSELENNNSGILLTTPLTGQYDIWVGTYDQSDAGADAQLIITEHTQDQWLSLSNDSDAVGGDTNSFDRTTILANSAELGTLAAGDDTLQNYGYADSYVFAATTGQSAIIDLSSSEFDTYLLVRTPSGKELSNDDFEGRTDRSLLSIEVPETGEYEIVVSSFMSSESGDYSLSFTLDDNSDTPGERAESGTLSSSDAQLESGEYIDIYELNGRPGQRLQADLRSEDFDTFLILITPSGEQFENDDMDSTNRSFLDMTLAEAGDYRVVVTSYGVGAVGDYTLQLDQDATSSNQTNDSEMRSLTVGQAIEGELREGASARVNDKWEDTYWFTGETDETLRIDLNSSDFDTYLRLVTPNGELIENDDFEGSISTSSVSLTLRENGRYRVVVTSYGANDAGPYELSLLEQSERIITPNISGGEIYGIFVGISDYPGTDADLNYTDQDATRARDALINGAGMRPENSITLLNSDATTANFHAAIERTAMRATPQDTFVLFYSGHGDRVIRLDGPDSADPDGLDETIELYDGAMIDDELALLFDTVSAGTTLLVLDSCFSGGFAKDLVSKPGRMGLFSSEEDVTSQVASKFRAGGYLSVFFEEALAGYADFDENGELTAIELSEYLHDRFRNDVKSTSPDHYVRTSGPQSGYQHLVVDRGGVGPYNILFNHQ
ncbi:MAG: caspase family protein [Gammaproteobacteria bacterium]